MPKSINYEVSLHPAQREGGFVITKWEMFGIYPKKQITAAGMPDLINQVSTFAAKHGEGCQASVRCLAPRKPPGFKRATSSLYYNLQEKPAENAHAD